jgi:UV DNA damage endonuclease
MRIGYACITLLRPELKASHTTVLRLATPERLREITGRNLQSLAEILRGNVREEFGLFRISSELIPFASHPVHAFDWRAELAEPLGAIGAFAREHDLRLSFHPGPYTVLNSLTATVVENALKDLEYQAGVLAAMGLDASHKVVMHGGVTQPARSEAQARLRESLDRLSADARSRIVIENDERVWAADEICAFCREAGVPMVFDILHHRVKGGAWAVRPLADLLAEVFSTWGPADGPPKIHYSTQDPEKKLGAHAYGVDADEFARFLDEALPVGRDFDIMFECKGKDAAVAPIRDLLKSRGWTGTITDHRAPKMHGRCEPADAQLRRGKD